MYSEVELLHRMMFSRPTILLTVAVPFYVPESTQVPRFRIFGGAWHCLCLSFCSVWLTVTSAGVRSYIDVVLTCISVISDAEHHSMCLFSLEKCWVNSLTGFWSELFLGVEFKEFPVYFGYQPLRDARSANMLLCALSLAVPTVASDTQF